MTALTVSTAVVYAALSTAPPHVRGKLDAMFGSRPPAKADYSLIVEHLDAYWLLAVIDHDTDNSTRWLLAAFGMLNLMEKEIAALGLPTSASMARMMRRQAGSLPVMAGGVDRVVAQHLHSAFVAMRRELAFGATVEARNRWHLVGAYVDLLRVASGPEDKAQHAVRHVQHHLVQAAGFRGERIDFALKVAEYIRAVALGDNGEIVRLWNGGDHAHAA